MNNEVIKYWDDFINKVYSHDKKQAKEIIKHASELRESVLHLTNIELIGECINSVPQDEQGSYEDRYIHEIFTDELQRRINEELIK